MIRAWSSFLVVFIVSAPLAPLAPAVPAPSVRADAPPRSGSMRPSALGAVGGAHVRMTGRLGARYAPTADYLIAQHDRTIPAIDFDMLAPFTDRGREHEWPWDGEYAGKWMDAAALIVAAGGPPELASRLDALAAAVAATQMPDGYTGIDLERDGAWDLWNMWYVLYGMLGHHEGRGDDASLACADRTGAYIVEHYLPPGPYDIFAGAWGGGCTVDVLDQLVRLYRHTGDPGLLELGEHIATGFPAIGEMRETGRVHLSHAYVIAAYLGGMIDYDVAREITDDLAWIDAIWRDIGANHLYPTGSVGQHEVFRAPDAYRLLSPKQETCATVEWLIGLTKMYEVTGEPWYAHRIEQAVYNALLAAQSVDGMSWMYYTRMNGGTKAWFTGPTKCCYWSGPRGLARLPGLLVHTDADGLRIDLYEASTITGLGLSGATLDLAVQTNYPADGRVAITLALDAPIEFTLRLRLPEWTRDVRLAVNDADPGVTLEPGGYAAVRRVWRDGDRVDLDLALPTRLVSNPAMTGIPGAAVQRGPEVLSLDHRDNPGLNVRGDIVLYGDPRLVELAPEQGRRRYRSLALVFGAPRVVVFTTFADAGNEGATYRSVFPTTDACTPPPADFNDDGVVDFLDLLALLAAWGDCPVCREDLDGDGVVGFGDLLMLLSAWTTDG